MLYLVLVQIQILEFLVILRDDLHTVLIVILFAFIEYGDISRIQDLVVSNKDGFFLDLEYCIYFGYGNFFHIIVKDQDVFLASAYRDPKLLCASISLGVIKAHAFTKRDIVAFTRLIRVAGYCVFSFAGCDCRQSEYLTGKFLCEDVVIYILVRNRDRRQNVKSEIYGNVIFDDMGYYTVGFVEFGPFCIKCHVLMNGCRRVKL